MLHIGVEENPVQLVRMRSATVDRPIQDVLRRSVTQDELASFERGWQSDDQCAYMTMAARCVLVCTEQPSRSVRVDLAKLVPDVDFAHGGDIRQCAIRLMDWVKVEPKVLWKYLMYETIAFVVDTFSAVAEVSRETCTVEGYKFHGTGIGEGQGPGGS